MKSLLLTSLMLVAAITACGDPDKKSGNQNGNENSQQTGDGSKISFYHGEKKVVFGTPAKQVDEAMGFTLLFELPKDGNKASVIAFADKTLENGVELQFTRQGKELHFELRANGKKQADTILAGIDASQTMNLLVDVHNNDGDNAHVLVWKSEGEAYEGHVHVHEEDALFNEETTDGKGRGVFSGLKSDLDVHFFGVIKGEAFHHHH